MRYILALLAIASCFHCLAGSDDYYRNFLSLADTNDLRPRLLLSPLLVDTNNSAPKLTNAVMQLERLVGQGKLGGIQLGMTMEEVVARWGKPQGLYSRCDGGPRFLYHDISLVFRDDTLWRVRLPPALVFDKGLTAQSTLKHWIRAYGEPAKRVDYKAGTEALYESTHCRVKLYFDPDGDMRSALMELPSDATPAAER